MTPLSDRAASRVNSPSGAGIAAPAVVAIQAIMVVMPLRVFGSYATREDQILALRLQTLASTRPGLQVYVPPASTRSASPSTKLDTPGLKVCDLVLALVTRPMPPMMQREMSCAAELGKPAIPIVLKGPPVNGHLAGHPVFALDPFDPVPAEQQIIEYLLSLHLAKSKHHAAVALVALAIGLLALAQK